MSIDRLPSGKHRARVHVGGGRYRSKSFTRRADAVTWERSATIAKQTGRVEQIDADLVTLGALAAEHMAARRPDLAQATYRTYRTLWRAHVHPHALAATPLRAIGPAAVERFKADLLAAGVGPVSVRQTLGLVQAVLERAVRHGVIRSNPVRAVSKPSGKRTTTVAAIGPVGVEKIRARLSGADAVLVSVLAYAGLRPGEARALAWGDIGRTIRVEHAADIDGSLKPTKTDHARAVRLVAPLAADLADWRRASGDPPDDALIFPRADGSPWTVADWRNWGRRKFNPAAKAAGVEIRRPYDLRHSAASLWLAEGINAVQVAAWLGHAPAMTLGTYALVIAELDPADRTAAADIIEAARHDISMTWTATDTVAAGTPGAAPPRAKSPALAGS